MHLEVIPFGRPTGQRPPLLLLHGAYLGAWVWQEHFIPYFEKMGWHGNAVSFRGHGQSDGYSTLDLWGLADFTDDAESVLDQMGGNAVVIGHSMGGAVAQLLAVRRALAGMVLLVSVPPSGMSTSTQQMWMFNPAWAAQLGFVLSLGALAVDPNLMSHGLFSNDTPASVQSQFMLRFQRESRRAALEVMMPQVVRRPNPSPPTLVIGGDRDSFVPKSELLATAAFWEADIEIVPGLPHGMTMDAAWQDAADPILGWLEHQSLSMAAE